MTGSSSPRLGLRRSRAAALLLAVLALLGSAFAIAVRTPAHPHETPVHSYERPTAWSAKALGLTGKNAPAFAQVLNAATWRSDLVSITAHAEYPTELTGDSQPQVAAVRSSTQWNDGQPFSITLRYDKTGAVPVGAAFFGDADSQADIRPVYNLPLKHNPDGTITLDSRPYGMGSVLVVVYFRDPVFGAGSPDLTNLSWGLAQNFEQTATALTPAGYSVRDN